MDRDDLDKLDRAVPCATHVMGLYYDDVDDFRTHVREAWATFDKWHEAYCLLRAKSSGKVGQLRFFASYFQPNTITAVDPELFSGMVIVSPRTPDRSSRGRPQFVMTRAKHPEAFDYFYRYIAGSIQDKHWYDYMSNRQKT